MLDGQAHGEARVVVKRGLAICSLHCFTGWAALFLAIIGYLAYLYYHDVFDKFLSLWLAITSSSLFIIEGSRGLNETTQNPNAVRQNRTTPIVKRLEISLSVIILFAIIITGITVLSFLDKLVFSGNIANPIYDLMFATAFIVYIIAASYGTWWGKEHHK